MVVYRIDAKDVLVGFNHRWDLSAHANGAPYLRATNLEGHSLWEFITDLHIRQLYQPLIELVRRGGGPVALRFQHDGRPPMEVALWPEAAGGVAFHCRVPDG